jgi:hypothetical protein
VVFVGSKYYLKSFPAELGNGFKSVIDVHNEVKNYLEYLLLVSKYFIKNFKMGLNLDYIKSQSKNHVNLVSNEFLPLTGLVVTLLNYAELIVSKSKN